jgi:hypothetical protein
VILAEEQARSLHPFEEQDLSVELGEIHEHVDKIEGEHTTEARQLSQLVIEISNALVDLKTLPIHNIPQHPKSAQEVLTVAGLFLERMREAQASDTGPWD